MENEIEQLIAVTSEFNSRHTAFEALQENAGPVLPQQLREQVEITNQLRSKDERSRSRVQTVASSRTLKFFVSSNLSHCSPADNRKLPRHPVSQYERCTSAPSSAEDGSDTDLCSSDGPPACRQTPGGQRRRDAHVGSPATRSGG